MRREVSGQTKGFAEMVGDLLGFGTTLERPDEYTIFTVVFLLNLCLVLCGFNDTLDVCQKTFGIGVIHENAELYDAASGNGLQRCVRSSGG